MTPSSGLVNLLEWLTTLREIFSLLGYRFVIKDYITQEEPDARDAEGKVNGEGLGAPTACLSAPFSPHLEALKPILLGFYGGSVT